MLDNHTRCCWFLTELSKKMWFKLMKKHDIDLQDSTIMIFSRLYKDELKKAQKMKWEHNLEKKMKKNKEKSKKNKKNKLNVKKIKQNQINKLISKFKSLALNLNILSEQLKQWDWLYEVSR